MYLSIHGKPTDKELERYPAVHLTGLHEWDPSVLDYTHPSGDGEPPWSNDPDERSAFDPNFDEFGDYTQGAIQTHSILDDSSSTLTPCPTLMTNQHVFRTYQHDLSREAPDYEIFGPYFGWVNEDTVQKTMEQSTQWGVSSPNTFLMKKHLTSRNPALNIPRRNEAVATDTVFSDTPAVDSGVENSSSLFFQISCSHGFLNSSRLSCYLLLRLLVYTYLSQLMRTFTNYLKCIVISS